MTTNLCTHTNNQRNKQTNIKPMCSWKQTSKQANKKANEKTNKQTKQKNKKTNKQTNKQTSKNKQTHKQTHTQTNKQTPFPQEMQALGPLLPAGYDPAGPAKTCEDLESLAKQTIAAGLVASTLRKAEKAEDLQVKKNLAAECSKTIAQCKIKLGPELSKRLNAIA